ncbi:MAG: (2Fe-2S)-binding protein [Gemmatimonadales bacterium]|nr:(2Fe-2S)-binding protein [Gemmatimonadales bacterium]
MTDELVSVTVDGAVVQVPRGITIIEAAKHAGVLVPHYCYHPSLSSPAVCRMCLVHVEKMPKLVPACVTPVADGQVISVHAPAARKAREGVLEFLLINHPLDCPICDQAGECELQDFVFQEGQARTRYSEYAKRYNPVEDFGPDVLYVPNRCILCTRCVRFMEEMAEAPVLAVAERGDRAYIAIDPHHQLDHPWSGNVVDLCPVGSLVSRDFLHRARAWELDKSASICPGCTQGCNITIETRDEAVVRLRPRPNLEVNRHFMCDTGRLDYRWMNHGDRAEAPLVRDGDRLVAADWDAVVARLHLLVHDTTGPVVVLASGRASSESLGWLMRMLEARSTIAAMKVPIGDEAPLAGVPGLALRPERAANLAGGLMVGVRDAWADAIARVGSAGLVILHDVDLNDAEAAAIAGAGTLVHFATATDDRLPRADLILPVTMMAEEQGVYVNRDYRAQRYLPARTAPGMARPAWWAASRVWQRAGSERTVPTTTSEAFAALPAFGGLTHRDLGYGGRILDPAVVSR